MAESSPPPLGAADLNYLWQLAKRLQACDSVSSAMAVAVEAEREATKGPALARAIAETVGPALQSLRDRERLQGLAIRDPLTGLYNRRFLEEELIRQISHMQRLGQPMAVAMLDLDHFRDYNERHGHLAGDLVLQLVAVLLQGFRQGSDVPCRYGGEEFVVLMPAVMSAAAATRLEPLLCRLAELGMHHDGRLLQPVTASIGVAEFPADGRTAAVLLDAADRAMYRAKRSGLNRICVAGAGR